MGFFERDDKFKLRVGKWLGIIFPIHGCVVVVDPLGATYIPESITSRK